jgi:hypothetical protein
VGAFPLFGQWTDPRLEMPYTRQASLGWSHEIMPSTILTIDAVRADGRDLNVRPRINVRINNVANSPRQLTSLGLNPDAIGTRPGISRGRSEYTALITGVKRRLLNGFDFAVSYTLAEAKSTIGTAADELNANNLQDAKLLYDDPRVFGPTSRTDARHSGSISAVWQVKGFNISPIFLYRSALPVAITEGVDRNLNSDNNDLPDRAYGFDGVGNPPEDIGPCETWNCGRGASRTQMNLRVSYGFHLFGQARIEAIGEFFNLFNAKNPSTFVTNRQSARFMQPNEYSGDFQNPEQRVGQIGFRFSF